MNTQHDDRSRSCIRRAINKAYLVTSVTALMVLSQPLAIAESSPEWIYSIRPYDTLIQFSNLYLINPDNWRELQKLNRIKNTYRMRVGSKLRVPLYLVKQSPTNAEVASIIGEAYLVKANSPKQLLKVGQQLTSGAEVLTQAKSKLNIRFADGSIVTVQSNSALKLDSLSIYSGGGMVDTKVRLQQGKIEVEANPQEISGNSMQILTPTAVAAVRGTEFRVSIEENHFREETLDGKVALSAGGKEVLVARGYGSLSREGKSPISPVTLLPAPKTSGLPITLTTVPLVFELVNQPYANAWYGKVYKNKSIVAENNSQGTRLNFGDIPDGKYLLKVRAKDRNGLEGYDAKHSFVLNARPYPPESIYPSEAVISREPKPAFTWTQVDVANQYLIELAKDSNFKTVIEKRKVGSTAFTPAKALVAGQYFWRLASIDGDDQGPYSKVYQFTYRPKPPAPDISHLTTLVKDNRVFVSTIAPPKGLVYAAILDNEMNHQEKVWQGADLKENFDFLLREYGKQTIRLRLVDEDGVAGPEAKVEFFAWSQW